MSEWSLRDMKGEFCWVKGLGDPVFKIKLDDLSRLESFLLMVESRERWLDSVVRLLVEGGGKDMMLSFPFLFAL